MSVLYVFGLCTRVLSTHLWRVHLQYTPLEFSLRGKVGFPYWLLIHVARFAACSRIGSDAPGIFDLGGRCVLLFLLFFFLSFIFFCVFLLVPDMSAFS